MQVTLKISIRVNIQILDLKIRMNPARSSKKVDNLLVKLLLPKYILTLHGEFNSFFPTSYAKAAIHPLYLL